MNKKLFLGMFAAAGMLLATSCSNDELDVVQSGNEAQVTFSLAAEGGIATRAISDGKSADVLVYAIPWTTPPVISAFLATGGDIMSGVVGFVILIVSVLIYIPFVKVMNKERAEQVEE